MKNKRQKTDNEDSDEEYKRVMEEEDPELERELQEAGLIDGNLDDIA